MSFTTSDSRKERWHHKARSDEPAKLIDETIPLNLSRMESHRRNGVLLSTFLGLGFCFLVCDSTEPAILHCEIHKESPEPCYGFDCMDCVYGYIDILSCTSYSSVDGVWPGWALSSMRDKASHQKRTRKVEADWAMRFCLNHLEPLIYWQGISV